MVTPPQGDDEGQRPARAFLSIGEALDALKPEFPDITISKIRFFETQGLVEPERTPSGYRKFTSADVQRLRWVLLTQHEAYVPLKVLKERMAAAEAAGTIPVALPVEAPRRRQDAGARLRDRVDVDLDDEIDDEFDADYGAPPDDADLLLSRAAHASAARIAATTAGAPAGAGLSDASAETMGEFRHPAARARSAGLRPTTSAKLSRSRSESGSPPSADTSRAAAGDGGRTAMPDASARQRSIAPADTTGAAGTAAVSAPSVEAPVASVAPLGSKNPMLGPQGGAAMSFNEMAAASGLSQEDLRLLEEFGLIVGRQMFDGRYYDEDALTVARTAATFRAFGVEPRHLRMYKSAAEREAAFFAQVISPVLHRRGEEARSRATATLGELRRLGEQLRDVALRQALRDVLEGR